MTMAMEGTERNEADRGSGGNFVELDTSSLTRPLLEVRIDGPYGAPAVDVFDNEVAILIGAGKLVCPRSLSCSFLAQFMSFRRRHSHCLNSEAYLVPPKEGKSWRSSSR